MSNVEKLMEKLKETGYRIGGLTVGTNPNVTAEEVAGEMLSALEEIESGNSEEFILIEKLEK